MKYSFSWLALAALLPVHLTGCSGTSAPSGRPALTPVSGLVFLDGEPVSGAVVTFQNTTGGPAAFGLTDATGAFELRTFEDGDGATRGEHRVTVTKFAPGEESPAVSMDDPAYDTPAANRPERPRNEVPDIYANPSTSGLTAMVPEEGQGAEVMLELASRPVTKSTSRSAKKSRGAT